MNRTEHDVIILGGGVNGAGIARDCAMRGLRTLLVEKNDLAKGASGANTGMIHGGIRYLFYDVHTTKMSCVDSGYIQRIAPHLLFRIPFLFPVFKGDRLGRFMLEGAEIFFEAYDVYQPLKRGMSHTRLTPSEVKSLEPGIDTDALLGALTMDEWGIDPFRLVIANAMDATSHGAAVLTYTEVESFLKDSQGAVTGVALRDRLTGATQRHSAPVVVNATGAWGPKLVEKAGASYALRPGKGVHIVYSHRISNYGIVMSGVDGRQMFLLPHENGTIAGTTDDDYYGDLDRPVATEDEVQYILQGARRVFPSIDQYRMSRTYVGIRPTLFAWGTNEDRLSRDHAFFDHAAQGVPGLISVAGGKLAAYRQLSEEVTDWVAERLGNHTACRTHLELLPGAEASEEVVSTARHHGLPQLVVSRMTYRHGANAAKILRIVDDDRTGGCQVCLCEPVTRAEVRYVCRTESVRRFSDIRRRTRLSMGACGGTRCLANASQILADELQLSPAEQLIELQDAMTARFVGKRPVLEGANLATEELGQAAHFLSAGLRPFFRAAQHARQAARDEATGTKEARRARESAAAGNAAPHGNHDGASPEQPVVDDHHSQAGGPSSAEEPS